MLPLDLANKIAAGEVVERPASVVKELLENAVDAGATRVELVVTAGGRKLVSVSDNGRGMNRDDALMAPERQATSKIRTLEDLGKIETMGFRGEALASIASVSRFTLRTRRREDDAGTEVRIDGGTLADVRDCGAAPGTVVEVRDLFYNVPARRAFLRSFQTEQAHVRMMFIVHAIAWPKIAFELTIDGEPIYRLRPAADTRERLVDLFGASHMDSFVEIDHSSGDIRVHGFAGLPSNTRSDYQGQYVFVNNRPSTAPVVQAAIREAYPHLEQGRRPVVFLFIDLPPEQVDVNVHPTKREVRFRATSAVRDAVLFAIDRALKSSSRAGAAGASVQPSVWPPVPPPVENQSAPPRDLLGGWGPSTPAPAPVSAPAPVAMPPVEQEIKYSAPEDSAAPWTKFKLIGSLSSGYVLLETEGGYAVVDPSAAHERVMYERLMKSGIASEINEQPLLLPRTLELNPLDAKRLRSVLDIMRGMGFDIEDFGKDAFLVRSLPEALSGGDAGKIIDETIRALEDAGPRKGREHWREELVAATASAAAVRTRKPLDERELMPILMELAACSMPYATPSGRPTMIFTSRNELDRRFGRI